jgi:hypothetical protein
MWFLPKLRESFLKLAQVGSTFNNHQEARNRGQGVAPLGAVPLGDSGAFP